MSGVMTLLSLCCCFLSFVLFSLVYFCLCCVSLSSLCNFAMVVSLCHNRVSLQSLCRFAIIVSLYNYCVSLQSLCLFAIIVSFCHHCVSNAPYGSLPLFCLCATFVFSPLLCLFALVLSFCHHGASLSLLFLFTVIVPFFP